MNRPEQGGFLHAVLVPPADNFMPSPAVRPAGGRGRGRGRGGGGMGGGEGEPGSGLGWEGYMGWSGYA